MDCSPSASLEAVPVGGAEAGAVGGAEAGAVDGVGAVGGRVGAEGESRHQLKRM